MGTLASLMHALLDDELVVFDSPRDHPDSGRVPAGHSRAPVSMQLRWREPDDVRDMKASLAKPHRNPM